jgi:serine/threonine-protein kinase
MQANPREDFRTDLCGKSVGRFLIRGRLGQGGMGEVYLAEDTALGRQVALKRMAPRFGSDAGARKRLRQEAQLASQLSDPHIAAVYDILEENDELFVVMEYVQGETLRERLGRPLPINDFLSLAVQGAEALVSAHKAGILHGDLKPENIMLTRDGQVKILDFGIAHRTDYEREGTTVESAYRNFGGTLYYMAPEVLEEKGTDGRTDIFSLGVVFYEALAGGNPFRAENFLATCERILRGEPPKLGQLRKGLSAELERIIAKMIARDPASRYATAADLAVDLRAERAALVQTSSTARHGARRTPLYLWIMAGVLAAALGLLLAPWPRTALRNWLARKPVPGAKQVAVLPFSPGDGENYMAAFDAGLTEALTAKLTQLTGNGSLQVVPASEIRAKGVSTAEQARREFGVNLALEGSVFRSGTAVRIQCILVDTGTLRQVRAQTLTLPVDDPFAAQDQVVQEATRMLEVDVPPAAREMLTNHGTQVARAYDYYLQGRGYLQDYEKAENLDSAIEVFERALSLDKDYALAYAGLGDAYWAKYQLLKDPQWVEQSHQACEKSLERDATLPAGHICLGRLNEGTGAYQVAAREFSRALDAEPTSEVAFHGLADCYQELGQLADAERTYQRAIALRPHYWAPYNWLGAFYYRNARYDEASRMFEQVVALAPDSFRGYSNWGASLVEQEHYDQAIQVLQHSISIRPTGSAYSNLANAFFYLRRYEQASEAYEQAVKLGKRIAVLWWNLGDGYYWTPGKRSQAASAYQQAIVLAREDLRVNAQDAQALGISAICHAMLGEKKAALDALHQALRLSPGDAVLRFKAALVYNQFGDRPQALEWLKQARAAGLPASRLRNTPNLDSLRTDPRFSPLL